MCFYITTPEKIAKKDIPCWKLFEKSKTVLRALYRNSVYRIGETYTTKKFTRVLCYISKGRHSYSTSSKAKDERGGWPRLDIVTVKCIIPKGTPYYYNSEDKEYVSLAIKLVKEI